MLLKTGPIWAQLELVLNKRIEALSLSSSSEDADELERLRTFKRYASAFVSGEISGERGNLGEMIFGEVHYNGLMSTPEVEALAWEFASAAREEGK